LEKHIHINSTRPLKNASFVIAVSQSPELTEGEAKQSHALLVEQGVATPCSVKIATALRASQ
jgi:hypothetical protein